MKKSIFNRMNVGAILGIIMALTIVMSADAQGPDRVVAEGSESNEEAYKDVKDELIVEDLKLDLEEEIPSVTFINKDGEVVAFLQGDKAVLEDIYTDRFSRSYFLTSSGVHEFYLIK
jgi:hypothetical protein